MQQAPEKKKKKVRVPQSGEWVETMVEIEVDDVSGPGWGPNNKHTLLNHHLTTRGWTTQGLRRSGIHL